MLGLVYLLAHAPDQCEATDRLAPPGWQGNFWGPSANQDRREGKLPKVPMTPVMTSWQNWGKKTLHNGDIVFRRGDARVLFGYFRFSQFLA
ncbi:MAG: YiiX/YebB-like N1pC/P60 family cysteine hydrolase, partial [Isosphaeraceae bacterium]